MNKKIKDLEKRYDNLLNELSKVQSDINKLELADLNLDKFVNGKYIKLTDTFIILYGKIKSAPKVIFSNDDKSYNLSFEFIDLFEKIGESDFAYHKNYSGYIISKKDVNNIQLLTDRDWINEVKWLVSNLVLTNLNNKLNC